MATTQAPSNAPAGQRLMGGWGGEIYRHGGTVRRQRGPWTPAVHELLKYLESVGFDGAPRVLGTDGDGFEVLTFVDGHTMGAEAGWPDEGRSEANLVAIGQVLRRFHDAVEGFQPSPGATWRDGRRGLLPGQIIGHNDASLANLVADSTGHVHSLIDWDNAGPTTRRADLAYAAWHVVGLHAPEHARARGWTTPPDIARRLRIFLDAYGLADRAGFVAEICDRIARTVREMKAAAERNGESVSEFVALLERDIAFVRSHRIELERAIATTGGASAPVRVRVAGLGHAPAAIAGRQRRSPRALSV